MNAVKSNPLIRIPVDLWEMLSAIEKFDERTIAEIVDPLIREEVQRLYDSLSDDDRRSVKRMAKARRKAKQQPAA